MHEETDYPVVHPKWRRMVKLYVWGLAAMVVLLPVGMIAEMFFRWYFLVRELGISLFEFIDLASYWWGAIAIIVSGLFLRAFLRCRNLLLFVSEHDGAVCPRCVKPMQVLDDERGEDTVRCPHCTSISSHHDLRQYWGGFPFPSLRWKRLWLQQQQTRWRVEAFVLKMRRWLIATPRRSSVVWMLLAVTPVTLWMANIGPGFHLDPAYLFFSITPLLLLVACFVILGLAIEPLEQDTLLCTACRYEKHGSECASPRCPECGSPWDAIGGVIYMGHRTNRKAILAASPLGILGVVLMMSSMTVPQRLASSDTLVNIIGAGSGDVFEWDEIGKRELSDAQAERLINFVLDHRDAGHRLESFENLWLSRQVRGGIDDEVLVRILEGMSVMTLDGPDEVVVGETFELALVVDRLSTAAPGQTMAYFGGFFVDDDPAPINRSKNPVALSYFGRGHPTDLRARFRIDPYEPTISLTGDTTGEVVVTARVWVTVEPRGVRRSDPIEWNEDGSPKLPEDVLWMKETHLEHRVRITP